MNRLTTVIIALSFLLSGCSTEGHIGRAEFYPLLNVAVGAGDEFSVSILLKRGADPTGFRDYEACHQKYGYGIEPSSHLYVAASAGHLEVMQLLTDAGADLNAQEGEGQTPLWVACARGHTDIVRFLLSRGARRDLKGEGITPLEVAQKYGFEAIVALLKEPNQPSAPTRATPKTAAPTRS